MLYRLLRPLLFLLPAETAHHLTLTLLNWAYKLNLLKTPQYITHEPLHYFGLDFPNPVGLAAGLDKNAEYIDALATLGFGFIEVGTVTPRPQSGNPKPRLFRLKDRQSLINRMGFNNKGVDYLLQQVAKSKYQGILGINIGKNADTPMEKAIDDYLVCLRKVYAAASYIVLNVSSPNTKDLRSLQLSNQLTELLTAVKTEQAKLAQTHGKHVPILLKLAPDLQPEEIKTIAHICEQQAVAGIIVTNTALDRSSIEGHPLATQKGGLSGQAILPLANSVLTQLHQALNTDMPIIGVGGITHPEDALTKQQAGAKLLQVYSGLVYYGPRLVIDIINLLARNH